MNMSLKLSMVFFKLKELFGGYTEIVIRKITSGLMKHPCEYCKEKVQIDQRKTKIRRTRKGKYQKNLICNNNISLSIYKTSKIHIVF